MYHPQRPKPPTGVFAFALLSFLDSRVTRCYGCAQSLKPEGLVPQAPNDLVVATRLHGKYFKDGRQHVSPEVSSVYCHVNLYCVTATFPGFQPSLCQVPSDLVPFCLPEHKFFFFFIANYLITTRKGFTVIFRLKDEILALWSEPALGEVRKAKNSARSLEFYSKAQANKVIKLFIIWLQIGKAHEIKRTSGEFT